MAGAPEVSEPIILYIGDESFARLTRYPETISKSAESLKRILTPESTPARFIRDDLEEKYRLYTAPLVRLAMAIGILGV